VTNEAILHKVRWWCGDGMDSPMRQNGLAPCCLCVCVWLNVALVEGVAVRLVGLVLCLTALPQVHQHQLSRFDYPHNGALRCWGFRRAAPVALVALFVSSGQFITLVNPAVCATTQFIILGNRPSTDCP